MNTRLTLSSLGSIQVNLPDSSSIQLNSEKLSALLFYLAMRPGQKIRREFLAELLWPELPIEAARSNLRHAFFRLRQVLKDESNSPPFLLSSREWLSFNPDSRYQLDVLQLDSTSTECPARPLSTTCPSCIRKLEEVADLYQGEFLAELDLPNCEEFNDWLQAERESMRRHVLALLERLSLCHEQNNALGRALTYAQRYLELEPWNEEGHRHVMRLYALSDQVGAALSQYEFCCKILKSELGVLPSTETQKLAESIRNGQLRPTPPSTSLTMNRRAGDNTKKDARVPRAALPAAMRQATVLYCELTHCGDEDIDEAMILLQTPQDRCVEIIRKLNGHLVTTHGGGLLAYFGYPVAREDAARLATRAALAAIRETRESIEIRIGIHTGPIITSGDLSLPDVVGKTSRLAIQLRQIARPGEIAISEKTQQLISGYYDCDILPGRSFSGMDRSSNIYRVVRESSISTQLEAASRQTPMTGRKDEIAFLLKMWKSAAKQIQAVMIKGEPGIGKSRLLQSLKELLGGESLIVRELRCHPDGINTPFQPVIAILESILTIEPDDTESLKLTKLSRFLKTHYSDKYEHFLPLLAQLLSLTTEPFTHCPSPTFRDQTMRALLEMLQAQLSRNPMLLIVEDIDWIDPSTLELIDRLLLSEKSSRLLALLTAKTEYAKPWTLSHCHNLQLRPLDDEATVRIIHTLNSSISLPATRHIIKHSHGIPLFIEEISRLIAKDSHAIIPESIYELLNERLEHIGDDAKLTAQLAASIGGIFNLQLLEKISPLDETHQKSALLQLLQSGLAVMINKSTFQFKHVLIQEAAYQSQTLFDRRAVHARIAQTLAEEFAHITKNRPELLALHYEKAGEYMSAIEFRRMAGENCRQIQAHAEAAENYRSCLYLIESLSANRERDLLEFELLLDLGTVLIASKNYNPIEMDQIHTRAQELKSKVAPSSERFDSLWGEARQKEYQ